MTNETNDAPSLIRDLEDAFKAFNAKPPDEGPLEAVRQQIQALDSEVRLSLIQYARKNAVACQDQPGERLGSSW